MTIQTRIQPVSKIVFLASVCELGISAFYEIMQGSFRPELSDYRFTGFTTAEHQAVTSALLVVSALVLVRNTRRNLPLHLGMIALGMLFLFLTKSLVVSLTFLMCLVIGCFVRRYRMLAMSMPMRQSSTNWRSPVS